jgi:hypothetical protein
MTANDTTRHHTLEAFLAVPGVRTLALTRYLIRRDSHRLD